MKKKLISLFLCMTLLATMLAGCGPKDKEGEVVTPDSTAGADNATGDEGGSDAAAEIYMFISQPEYADAINALIEEYKKVKPNVTINYETTQNDYPTMLKAKLNSGSSPDIFASASGKEIDVYKEYSLDLSDQPLMDTMLPAVKSAMVDGEGNGMYGIAIKGNYFGMIYNKDLFTAAGIEKAPETLTELEAAITKLEAANITPFTGGFAEWWVFKHLFQHFLNAATDDVPGLVKKFESGEAKFKDYPELYDNFFRFVDLVKDHGDSKPLEADLSAELAAFGSGQAAMVIGQGAWVEADIKKIDPESPIGFAGYPVSDNAANSQVITGADQALRISKDSKNLPAVLDFVNWWYTSDYGKSWFTDVAGVVSPVITEKASEFEIIKQGSAEVEAKGSGTLGVIYSTDSFFTAFGEAMQGYVAGTSDKDKTCETIEQKWMELDGSKK